VTKNPVYLFLNTPGSVGLFVLRITVASLFFLHGSQKAFGWFGGLGWEGTVADWTSPGGLGLPAVLATSVIVLELAISFLLLFGFLARLAGLLSIAVMVGVLVVLSKNTSGIMDFELPLLTMACGFAILSMGAGALSIDRTISKHLLPIIG